MKINTRNVKKNVKCSPFKTKMVIKSPKKLLVGGANTVGSLFKKVGLLMFVLTDSSR